jgi:hypothetical protein
MSSYLAPVHEDHLVAEAQQRRAGEHSTTSAQLPGGGMHRSRVYGGQTQIITCCNAPQSRVSH